MLCSRATVEQATLMQALSLIILLQAVALHLVSYSWSDAELARLLVSVLQKHHLLRAPKTWFAVQVTTVAVATAILLAIGVVQALNQLFDPQIQNLQFASCS